ncbi:MAG: hypothetical protein J5449_07840 [Oscillospiraceae bacterium]|nr:hypothetical protein [Oscillospiraceae bacterium]
MLKGKKEGGALRASPAVGVTAALAAAAILSLLVSALLYEGRITEAQLPAFGAAATFAASLIGTLVSAAGGKERKRRVLLTLCVLLAMRAAAGAASGELLSAETAFCVLSAAAGAIPAFMLCARRAPVSRKARKHRNWAK